MNIAYCPRDLPDLEIDHGLKISPYDYQLKGIARGLQLKRFINADEPGLGKTLQSIATINIANAFPCLVICPSSLKINWEREWIKFTDKKALVLTDSTKETWPMFAKTGLKQVFIVNYESLKKYFVYRINKEEWTLKDVEFMETINIFKSVIIDESHRVKAPSTQQARFCKGICHGKEWIIELTGTPVVNRPNDLISQLSIIDRMSEFGGVRHFKERYCGEFPDLEELNYHLNDKCMFRREKREVMKDLPDKIRQVIITEISTKEEYDKAEEDLVEYLRRYKQASDEKIRSALKGEVMVRIGVLKQISARGKLEGVKEFVRDFIENGQKIILFCSLHVVVDYLKESFPTSVSVTGRETAKEKQRAVDDFQNNPDVYIIICSIKSAGVGLTLTASSNVAFIEFPWTDADCCQCEDRAHRIGAKDSVTAYYFLGKNTIDSKLYSIIHEKRSMSNRITGNNTKIKEDVVDFISLMYR